MTTKECSRAVRPHEDISDGLSELISNPGFSAALVHLQKGETGIRSTLKSLALRVAPKQTLAYALRSVKTSEDFQQLATNRLEDKVFAETGSQFDVRGAEHVPCHEGSVMVGPHYFILDPAIVKAALLHANRTPPIVPVGNNLYSDAQTGEQKYDFVDSVFHLTGCIKVPRGSAARGIIHMGTDIVNALVDDKVPVYLEQQAQRNKSGIIETHPSLVKMLFSGAKHSGKLCTNGTFSTTVVPVGISAEYIPTDTALAYQYVTGRKEQGADVRDMRAEILDYKGTVSVYFGQPFPVTITKSNAKQVANQVNKNILRVLPITETQFTAYALKIQIEDGVPLDELNGSDVSSTHFSYLMDRFSHIEHTYRMSEAT